MSRRVFLIFLIFIFLVLPSYSASIPSSITVSYSGEPAVFRPFYHDKTTLDELFTSCFNLFSSSLYFRVIPLVDHDDNSKVVGYKFIPYYFVSSDDIKSSNSSLFSSYPSLASFFSRERYFVSPGDVELTFIFDYYYSPDAPSRKRKSFYSSTAYPNFYRLSSYDLSSYTFVFSATDVSVKGSSILIPRRHRDNDDNLPNVSVIHLIYKTHSCDWTNYFLASAEYAYNYCQRVFPSCLSSSSYRYCVSRYRSSPPYPYIDDDTQNCALNPYFVEYHEKCPSPDYVKADVYYYDATNHPSVYDGYVPYPAGAPLTHYDGTPPYLIYYYACSTYLVRPGYYPLIYFSTMYDDDLRLFTRSCGSFDTFTSDGYPVYGRFAYLPCLVFSTSNYNYDGYIPLPISPSICSRVFNRDYNFLPSRSVITLYPVRSGYPVGFSFPHDDYCSLRLEFYPSSPPSQPLSFSIYYAFTEGNERSISRSLSSISDNLSSISRSLSSFNYSDNLTDFSLFDNSSLNLHKNSISSLLSSFFSNSPFSFQPDFSFVDSYCSLSSSVFGHSVSVSFCSPSVIAFFDLIGHFVVLIATLTFFYIVFRG